MAIQPSSCISINQRIHKRPGIFTRLVLPREACLVTYSTNIRLRLFLEDNVEQEALKYNFISIYNGIFRNVSTGNFAPVTPKKGMFTGTKDFLESNSIVAKVAFLLLVLIVFILLVRLGIQSISYFMAPSSSPTLIDGMIDATHMQVIPQNPDLPNAVPILRSVNQEDGIEFTWGVWTYIKNLKPENLYKHVFHKGNNKVDHSLGMNFPNNAPGLYIALTRIISLLL